MKWIAVVTLISAAVLLTSCRSEPPRAPIGLNKRPANPPAQRPNPTSVAPETGASTSVS